MATPNSETDETRIAELRREILSYRPTSVSRFGDGGRGASDSDKLEIGLVDLGESGSSVVSALRCALHGATERMHHDDHPEALSSDGDDREVEYLTNSVSVVSRTISCKNNVISRDYLLDILQELSKRVGAFLLLVRASLVPYFTSDVTTLTKRLTGRSPISIILCDTERNDIERLKEYLRSNGIDDIYELPDCIHLGPNIMSRMSSEQQLKLLEMLQRCLVHNDDLTTASLTERLEVVSIR